MKVPFYCLLNSIAAGKKSAIFNREIIVAIRRLEMAKIQWLFLLNFCIFKETTCFFFLLFFVTSYINKKINTSLKAGYT